MNRICQTKHNPKFSPNANGVGVDVSRVTGNAHAGGVAANSLLKIVGWTPRPSEFQRKITDEASVLRVFQQAAKRKARRGASLIELMVVISIISILFGMVGVVFHRLFLSEQVAMRAALAERTVSRLADQFRRDVHASTTAMRTDNGDGLAASLTLTSSTDAAAEPNAAAKVIYSFHDGEVLRELIADGKTTGREVYRLPECRLRLPAATNEGRVEMVGLVIERRGSTITPQPQATRPWRSLVIEAALGRDGRLRQALVSKPPETAKEELK